MTKFAAGEKVNDMTQDRSLTRARDELVSEIKTALETLNEVDDS